MFYNNENCLPLIIFRLSVCQLQRYKDMTEFYYVNFLAPPILNAINKIFGPKLAHSSSMKIISTFEKWKFYSRSRINKRAKELKILLHLLISFSCKFCPQSSLFCQIFVFSPLNQLQLIFSDFPGPWLGLAHLEECRDFSEAIHLIVIITLR